MLIVFLMSLRSAYELQMAQEELDQRIEEGSIENQQQMTELQQNVAQQSMTAIWKLGLLDVHTHTQPHTHTHTQPHTHTIITIITITLLH
jgi:hypothetical protein